jgi:hypothetical protein
MAQKRILGEPSADSQILTPLLVRFLNFCVFCGPLFISFPSGVLNGLPHEDPRKR